MEGAGGGIFLGSVYATMALKTAGFTSDIASAQSQMRGLGNSFDETESRGSRLSSFLGGAMQAGLVATGIGAVAAAGAAVKMAGDFQQTLSVLRYNSGATSEQFALLSAKARELGRDAALPGISAADAASAMNELAKAGLSVNDVLVASHGVLSLAKAGNIDVGLAATTTARALNAFQLEGKDATRIADLLAAAANASSADVEGFAMGLQMAGAGARQMKVPLEDTVTALSLFSNAGINGSDAGTSLKQMFQQLANPTQTAADLMKHLGLDFFDTKGEFIGLAATADQLRAKLGKLTTEQKNQAIAGVFGADASRVAGILMNEGSKGFDTMRIAVTKQGAAAQAAAAYNDGFKGALDNLKSTLETVGTDIGLKVLPALSDMIKFLANTVIPGFTELGSDIARAVSAGFRIIMAHAQGFVQFGTEMGAEVLGGFQAGIAHAKGFATSLITELQAGDYAGLGATVAAAFVSGIKRAQNSFGEILKIVKGTLGKYDWVGLGVDLGKKVIPGLVLGLALGLVNFDPAPLFKGLKDHMGDAIIGILTIAFAPAKLLKPVTMGLGKVPLAGKFIVWILEGINGVGGVIKKGLGDLAKSGVGGFVDGLGLQGPRVVPAIVSFFRAIPAAIGSKLLDAYSSGLGISEAIGRGLAEGGPRNVVVAFQIIRSKISSMIGTLGAGLLDFGAQVIGQFGIGFRIGIDNLGSVLGFLRTRILGPVADFGSFLFNKGLDLIGGLSGGITAGFSFIGEQLVALRSFIFGGTGNFISTLYGRGIELLAGLVSGMDGWLVNVGGAIARVAGRAVSTAANFGSVLYDAGRSLVQGLLDGAGSLLSTIASFMADKLPAAIRGPFRKALGIHSPSTVFAGYGVNVVEGLANGITGSQGLVSNAMSSLQTQLSVAPVGSAVSSASQSGLSADGLAARTSTGLAGGVTIEQYNVNNSIDPERIIRDFSRRVALA